MYSYGCEWLLLSWVWILSTKYDKEQEKINYKLISKPHIPPNANENERNWIKFS